MIASLIAQIASLSIPVPVTLACACACAYMLGKIPKDLARSNSPESAPKEQPPVANRAPADERRAERLINKLTIELAQFRQDLDAHTESLDQLRTAITYIDQDTGLPEKTTLALRAIQRHCRELPVAFDTIRQVTQSAVESLVCESAAGTNRDVATPAS